MALHDGSRPPACRSLQVSYHPTVLFRPFPEYLPSRAVALPRSAAFEKPLDIGGLIERLFTVSLFSSFLLFRIHFHLCYKNMQSRPGTSMSMRSMRSASKVERLFALCDPEFRLVTSPWVTPRVLFFIRFAMACYAIVAGVVDLVFNIFILDNASQ